jgi:Fe-S-cluster containining protein
MTVCGPRALRPVPADLMPRPASLAAEGFRLAPQFEEKMVLKRVYSFKGRGPLPVRKNSIQSNPNFKSSVSEFKLKDAVDINRCLMNYRDLLTRVDRLLDSIQRQYSGHIVCHKGCDCGCRNLSVFPIEALSLVNAVQDLSEETGAKIRQRAAAAWFWDCPLLEDRTCSMYTFRPLICRTHGFPLRTQYKGQPSIGYCRYNFKDMSSVPADAIIDLDNINHTLRAINASVVGELAHTLYLPERLSIAEAILIEAY